MPGTKSTGLGSSPSQIGATTHQWGRSLSREPCHDLCRRPTAMKQWHGDPLVRDIYRRCVETLRKLSRFEHVILDTLTAKKSDHQHKTSLPTSNRTITDPSLTNISHDDHGTSLVPVPLGASPRPETHATRRVCSFWCCASAWRISLRELVTVFGGLC